MELLECINRITVGYLPCMEGNTIFKLKNFLNYAFENVVEINGTYFWSLMLVSDPVAVFCLYKEISTYGLVPVEV